MTMFWTDAAQATERLVGTFVLLGDEPVYVESIRTNNSAVVRRYNQDNTLEVPLDDKRFHRFRKLPKVGWFNSERRAEALFFDRRPVRSRLHGLGRHNVTVLRVGAELQQADASYDREALDPGYHAANKDDYPSLEQVVTNLQERSTMALSPMYAVRRDDLGLRWLFRAKDKVGIFPDANTLLLVGKYNYLREELTESPIITTAKIQEF